MENPEALGFHQETMKESRQRTEMTKNLVNTSGLVLYKTLHYFITKLCFIHLCGSRNVISTKPYFQIEEITTNFSYKIQNPKPYFQIEEITTNFSYKIQNHRRYLNVSRNIII